MNLGAPELILILIIVLVIFGAGRLPQVFSSLGKGVREFRDASEGREFNSDAPGRRRSHRTNSSAARHSRRADHAAGPATSITGPDRLIKHRGVARRGDASVLSRIRSHPRFVAEQLKARVQHMTGLDRAEGRTEEAGYHRLPE